MVRSTCGPVKRFAACALPDVVLFAFFCTTVRSAVDVFFKGYGQKILTPKNAENFRKGRKEIPGTYRVQRLHHPRWWRWFVGIAGCRQWQSYHQYCQTRQYDHSSD